MRMNFHHFSIFKQIILLCLLLIVFNTVFNLIVLLIAKVLPSNHFLNLKIANVILSIGIFIGVPYIFLYLVKFGRNFFKFRKFKYKYLFISIGVYLLTNIVSLGLEKINRAIPMPSFFETFTMDEQLIKYMAYSNSIMELLANIFFIALVPAVTEEILFRGFLMNLFTKWLKKLHLGIILSSLIFSLVHFNFYTIIPIFFMGCVSRVYLSLYSIYLGKYYYPFYK